MAYPDQLQNTGSFVPTTFILDVAQLQEVDVKSPEFKELLVRLYQNLNLMVISLNTRDAAFYLTQEFVNGQLFFGTVSNSQDDLRPDFRTVVNTGALGPGVTTVAHNIPITNTYNFTRIYGEATDNIGFNYYPLPWASAAGVTNIELKVNNTNVVITNNSGVAFTESKVILEYLKQL